MVANPIKQTALAQANFMRDRVRRLIFWLHNIEGYTFVEIGEVLGVSFTRISQMCSQYERKLKDDIDEQAHWEKYCLKRGVHPPA